MKPLFKKTIVVWGESKRDVDSASDIAVEAARATATTLGGNIAAFGTTGAVEIEHPELDANCPGDYEELFS